MSGFFGKFKEMIMKKFYDSERTYTGRWSPGDWIAIEQESSNTAIFCHTCNKKIGIFNMNVTGTRHFSDHIDHELSFSTDYYLPNGEIPFLETGLKRMKMAFRGEEDNGS
jgi:hypothetical protein